MPQSSTEPRWGVDSEYGRLRDVLLCGPDHFRWLPTSAISRATIERGERFDAAAARSQHAEMVSAYEGADVRAHFLEARPELPYQVFTRDSSTMTPGGTVVTQLHQWWRRGEYAPVIEFMREHEVPVRGMVTAAALEGGDVVIVEPGAMLIGHGEERTQEPAARQLAAWMEADGWEARVVPIPGTFVHIDVLVSVLGPKLAVVCAEACPAGVLEWLRGRRFELIEVAQEEALRLGVNAISLGDDRVLSAAGSAELNGRLEALGLEVLAPELGVFTLGGGGAHCLAQPLRRDPVG